MEAIENNISILLVIFFMLLGAFLIGYFFGNSGTKERMDKKPPLANKKIKSVKKQVKKQVEKIEIPSKNPESKDMHRIEIDEISEPGQIRAKKTRERAGKLSEEIKTEMASKSIDFTNIGTGNKSEADDFQKILGIGSFVEEKLNTIGIYNYSQLAQMTDEDIRAITKVIEFFPGRIHRDDWKGQAKDLMKDSNRTV